jgi:hypothetical protein
MSAASGAVVATGVPVGSGVVGADVVGSAVGGLVGRLVGATTVGTVVGVAGAEVGSALGGGVLDPHAARIRVRTTAGISRRLVERAIGTPLARG